MQNQIIILFFAILALIFFLIFKKLKSNNFLTQNPDKSVIIYIGGEAIEGVIVHRILSQDMTDEYMQKDKTGRGGAFSINAGEIELEIERVSFVGGNRSNIGTPVYHGKTIMSFFVKKGKKYFLRYNKKKDLFYVTSNF